MWSQLFCKVFLLKEWMQFDLPRHEQRTPLTAILTAENLFAELVIAKSWIDYLEDIYNDDIAYKSAIAIARHTILGFVKWAHGKEICENEWHVPKTGSFEKITVSGLIATYKAASFLDKYLPNNEKRKRSRIDSTRANFGSDAKLMGMAHSFLKKTDDSEKSMSYTGHDDTHKTGIRKVGAAA